MGKPSSSLRNAGAHEVRLGDNHRLMRNEVFVYGAVDRGKILEDILGIDLQRLEVLCLGAFDEALFVLGRGDEIHKREPQRHWQCYGNIRCRIVLPGVLAWLIRGRFQRTAERPRAFPSKRPGRSSQQFSQNPADFRNVPLIDAMGSGAAVGSRVKFPKHRRDHPLANDHGIC